MKELVEKIKFRFQEMCATGKLYRSAATGEELWDIYLRGFGKDPIFRDPNSSVHNCKLCNNFIRRYGNVVALDQDYNIMTMFDVDADEEYANSMKLMSQRLRMSNIIDIFLESYHELVSLPYERITNNMEVYKLGVQQNFKMYTQEEADMYGVVTPSQVYTFNHFSVDLPKEYVITGSVAATMGKFRDLKNVMERGLETIPTDTLLLVRDLINQGSLLNGTTYLHKLEAFIQLKSKYDVIPDEKLDNWCWAHSGSPVAGFRNELIGTLCVELAEGKELNDACKTWNIRVDPVNYMKAASPVTQGQIKEAKKFVEENGYEESFERRLVTLEDIKVDDILHVRSGDGSIPKASIFDGISKSTRHKRAEFKNVEEMPIEKFMKDVLPSCTSVELFLENRFDGNMMTLTTAKNNGGKPIFKWNNNYSWSYNGNLSGKSQIKEAVKVSGGKVDGVLRFSIMWAEDDPTDNSDLDAHCITPRGKEIYFGDRCDNLTLGELDVDITQPTSRGNKNIVENITFPVKRNLERGTYVFKVNPYALRGVNKGFRAEIEVDGTVYTYSYEKKLTSAQNVAKVLFDGTSFTVNHILPESENSKTIYGLDTNSFHKVNLVCLSPNHWQDPGVGNKHYFFMLEGCQAPQSVRGFHNDNLNSDLVPHRKVMDVLGTTTMIEPNGKQLSGVGFNATVRDEVILRLKGSFNRMVKIKL